MTSFVHVDQPTEHPGVRRAEALIGYVAHLWQRIGGGASAIAARGAAPPAVDIPTVYEALRQGRITRR